MRSSSVRWLIAQSCRCTSFMRQVLHVRIADMVRGKPAPAIANRRRMLLVDVSVVTRSDARTGIQRVVRALASELVRTPPAGFEVRLGYATRWGGFRLARQEGESFVADGRAVRLHRGDIFLGLDFSSYLLPRKHHVLLLWKLAGARLVFVVYDLLPAARPDWFKPADEQAHAAWLRTLSIFGDAAMCISATVAAELKAWLRTQLGEGAGKVSIGWFHLGADIEASLPDKGMESGFHDRLTRLAHRPFFLMVGTLEPRKGYAQALGAYEVLRAQGQAPHLAIVGKPGWKVDAVIAGLRAHPDRDASLFWFPSATDEALHALYEACTGILIASEGEGFGLPLIEAARFGKPILARDIPVFREVAGNNASYFSCTTDVALALEIGNWMAAIEDGTAPLSQAIPVLTWRQSAEQLATRVVHLVEDAQQRD